MNLTATDRSALIRLASSLPKGGEERKAILSGLKVAAVPGASKKAGLEGDVLYLLSRGNNTPWTTDEIWAQLNRDELGIDTPALFNELVSGDLGDAYWDSIEGRRALRLFDSPPGIDRLKRTLEDLAAKGRLTRLKVHGGGGEWVLP